jgi:hypothetical protein
MEGTMSEYMKNKKMLESLNFNRKIKLYESPSVLDEKNILDDSK